MERNEEGERGKRREREVEEVEGGRKRENTHCSIISHCPTRSRLPVGQFAQLKSLSNWKPAHKY